MPKRIGLIVDNPLRDLDGLVLLAWHLAGIGCEVFLIPMYDQACDVLALSLDIVVVNYVRSNNRDLLATYRRAGIRVVVLDTEGTAGKTIDDFAKFVSRMRCSECVDLYLLWGPAQHQAFVRAQILPADRMKVTGCPRYDFCAAPWRETLDRPHVARPYVLVNTNFPAINPRFSAGTAKEVTSAVAVGFDPQFVADYVREAPSVHREVLGALERVATDLPDVQLVIRPHPFEDAAPYQVLQRFPNVAVRQEGTSIQWINSAAALLHMNCSTAVEAVMLGCEPVSLEWLNTATLRVRTPTIISRLADSYEMAIRLLREALTGRLPPVEPDIAMHRASLIEEVYYAVDGRSAERVCSALLEQPAARTPAPRSSVRWRTRLTVGLRSVLGYRASERLRRLIADQTVERRRAAKRFDGNLVAALVRRLNAVGTPSVAVTAAPASAENYVRPHLASGSVIRVYR